MARRGRGPAQGFKVVTRTTAPCDPTDVTIGILGSRRASIRGNRLLAPGSDGTEACSQAIGIAVVNGLDNGQPGGSASSAGSATIASNEVRDARFGAIMAFAVGGHVDMDASHNSILAHFGQQSTVTSSITALAGAQFGIGFRGNTLAGKGAYCVDQSSGSGTSGTANTWSGNVSALGGSPSGSAPRLRSQWPSATRASGVAGPNPRIPRSPVRSPARSMNSRPEWGNGMATGPSPVGGRTLGLRTGVAMNEIIAVVVVGGLLFAGAFLGRPRVVRLRERRRHH